MLERDLDLLEVLPELGRAQDRLRDPPRDQHEGDQAADRQFAGDRRLHAEIEHERGGQLGDELRRRLRPRPEDRGLEPGLHIGRKPLLPFALEHRLDRRRLQGLDADDALDQQLLPGRPAAELLLHLAPEGGTQHRADHDIKRPGQQDDRGEFRRIDEQHRDINEHEKQVDDRGNAASGQEPADRFDLARPGDDHAGGTVLEIGDRQAEQMREQPRAQLDVDAVGRVVEDVDPQVFQQRLEDGEQHHGADHDDQRRVALVAEHLVDHELEGQRRRQPQQLDEERGHQHVGERAPVALDRRQEPGQAELHLFGRHLQALGDQHDLAVEPFQDFLDRQILLPARHRVHHAEPARRLLHAEHGPVAAPQPDQRRHRQAAQPLGVRVPHQPRLEADQLRRAHQILAVRRLVAERELVRQFGGRDLHAMKRGDLSDRHQAAVHARNRAELLRGFRHQTLEVDLFNRAGAPGQQCFCL